MFPDLSTIRSVLCLGAHPDDIEIGCGGTILRILEINPEVQLDWVVFSGNGARRSEAEESFHAWGGDHAARCFRAFSFKDAFFPGEWTGLKRAFQEIAAVVQPQLIFTHHLRDRHQDHHVVGELTWNTFRSHWILEYEVPKYEGDLGQPNVFSPLTDAIAERKVQLLMDSFPSQREKPWFDPDAFRSVMRLRGIEAKACWPWAEAFHGRKLWLGDGGPVKT